MDWLLLGDLVDHVLFCTLNLQVRKKVEENELNRS